MIITISSSGWFKGCQCNKRTLIHHLKQVFHPPDPSGDGHQQLKVVHVAHISYLTFFVNHGEPAVEESSASQGYKADI